jgi:hypothetical protein
METVIKSYTLDTDTVELLRRIGRYTGESHSQIVRWALAHYATCGPWHAGIDQDRDADLGHPPALPIGPQYSRRLTS